SASRRLGMALGEVKEVTSIFASPVCERRSISAILSAVGTKSGSIWKPSRVATSWIYRRLLMGESCRFWASRVDDAPPIHRYGNVTVDEKSSTLRCWL